MAAISTHPISAVAAVGASVARPRIWTYRAGVIWALIGVIAANGAADDWLIVTICGVGILVLMLFDRFRGNLRYR